MLGRGRALRGKRALPTRAARGRRAERARTAAAATRWKQEQAGVPLIRWAAPALEALARALEAAGALAALLALAEPAVLPARVVRWG